MNVLKNAEKQTKSSFTTCRVRLIILCLVGHITDKGVTWRRVALANKQWKSGKWEKVKEKCWKIMEKREGKREKCEKSEKERKRERSGGERKKGDRRRQVLKMFWEYSCREVFT